MVCSFYLLHDNYSGFETGGKLFANDGYNFARKWLQSHPKFITNSLYIAGDSYAGKIVPIIVQAISDGKNTLIRFKLVALSVVSNGTNVTVSKKSTFQPAISKVIWSVILRRSAKRNCKEEYIEVNMSVQKILKLSQRLLACVMCRTRELAINAHSLGPSCLLEVIQPDKTGSLFGRDSKPIYLNPS
ncbi:serine carboxypeptidase-like 18 [Gossypium australe]|uniref:Serine carboxypeptidase-like 18 n=1 Tax=Gossypium australe TaxID=47621 RepID=A0A5B6UU18_9ROSI|nr:serine carboxypeptidase-like 18 [Gossypium australe]